MPDWDKLRVFNAVAEAGSLTHAGETLHLSQSAVSRQIRGLEEALGSTLFHRHPRGLILTSEGELLFEATQAITTELGAATAKIRDNREGVHGPLRVTTTVDFGTIWLIPRLAKLYEAHPGLAVDLVLTETVLDLPMRDADVAVRMRPPTQADVIAKPLWRSQVGLYASRSYVEARGAAADENALEGHDLLAFSPKSPQPASDMDWLFRDRAHGRALRPKFFANSLFALREAALNHLGVAPLPAYLADGLVRVAPAVAGPEIVAHIVYAQELRRSKRVAVFKAFLEAELSGAGL